MKYILASLLLVFSLSANAQFTSGMTTSKIADEVSIQSSKKVSIQTIVINANSAKISMIDLAGILTIQGHSPIDVASTIVRLHPELAGEVTKIVVSIVPEQKEAIIKAVLAVPNVDPASVLAASAAGVQSAQSYNFKTISVSPNSLGAVSPH